MKNVKMKSAIGILTALLTVSVAHASDQKLEALEGLNFGPLPAINQEEMEAQMKKDGLALPSDIKKAMDECMAEKKGPSCINGKLKAAGFKTPELPPGAKELDDCLNAAAEKGNNPDDVKACFDKYAPKPGNVAPPVSDGKSGGSSSTSTSTSTSNSRSAQ